MKRSNLKISTRMNLGFGLVLSALAIIIAVAFARFSSIEQTNNQIINTDWVKVETINIVRVTTKNNAILTLQLLIATDQPEINNIHQQINGNKQIITEALNVLKKLVYSSEESTLLETLNDARIKYVASFSKVSKFIDETKRDEAATLMKTETLPYLDNLQKLISDMVELQKKNVTASNTLEKNEIHSGKILIMWIGIAAVFLGIYAAYIVNRSISRPLTETVRIAQTIAAGDLSQNIEISSKDEIGQLLLALRDMHGNLLKIITQIRDVTDTIVSASSQITTSNLDLSSRTEEQASTLKDTASSMDRLTNTVKQSASKALQASQLAHSSSEVATKGGNVVSQVVDTMGQINSSSGKIVDITGVIDGIAFQTNILALNAAVEAARAGEQGRGFAVVATEVRNLAQRSAAAAKEIKSLIDNSVDNVHTGSRLVEQAGTTMSDMVASVKHVTDIINEITVASNEQASGIAQVNQAIIQMDQVTQQNATLVEQVAATAKNMQDQSEYLSRVVGMFKLPQNETESYSKKNVSYAALESSSNVAKTPTTNKTASLHVLPQSTKLSNATND